MSRKSEVIITWACDVCGATELEVDGYSPNGWKQVVHALISAQLGNVTAQHLCGNCSTSLHLLLDGRLGDAGDLEQAWDEGAEATTEWMANNPSPAGIPQDPPRNPYAREDQR